MGVLDWVLIALWAVIFIVTLIIELETSNLTTIWFCVAAVVTFICALLGLGAIWQLIVFVVLSTILVLSTRPLTKKMMNTDIIHTNSDKIIGMIAIVTKDILESEIGEIKVDNNLWRAISIDGLNIFAGEKVIVNSLSGNKAVVSKVSIKKEENIDLI